QKLRGPFRAQVVIEKNDVDRCLSQYLKRLPNGGAGRYGELRPGRNRPCHAFTEDGVIVHQHRLNFLHLISMLLYAEFIPHKPAAPWRRCRTEYCKRWFRPAWRSVAHRVLLRPPAREWLPHRRVATPECG